MKQLWILTSILGVVVPGFAGTPKAINANLPLTFEPNRGQAADSAKFIARGTGYYLTVEQTGSRVLLRQRGKTAEIKTRFAGSKNKAEMLGLVPLPGHSSYFHGKDASKWITDIPNYAKVRTNGVYAGIDVVYYGNQNKLEYDFVVSPGADANQIRLAFDGVSQVSTDAAGNLVLATPAGNITEHKPDIYQLIAGVKRPVNGGFRIERNNQVRFDLGKYDRSAELIIDPVLVYSSFLGGADDDNGNAIAADGAANTYMTGVTYSTPDGDADVLVRKISADGTTILYNADLGGSDDDFGNGIAIDVNGYAFVGGRTLSSDFPTLNAFQNVNYGLNNAYVVRINPTGDALVFSTYVGGSSDDRGYAVAVDKQGSVYLTGAATSNDFPISNGAFQTTRKGGADAFVIKFAYNGAAIYSTFIGGGSDDLAYGIAVDTNGNAYIAGETSSDSFPQTNAPYQHSRHGGLEGFVTEVNGDGSGLVFSTFIGGSGDDFCNGVALDPSGNIYVTGTTTSGSDFSIPNRTYNTSYNGGASDIFVAKYLPNGQNIGWITFLGSHGTDEGNAIAADANGNVYVVGDTDSSQYPTTRDAVQSTRGGKFDVVLSVLDTNGQNLVYSTFYGGQGDESAVSVALDQYYEVYMTGYTSSSNLVISTGAFQNFPGGGSMDAFVAKISVYGSAVPGASATVNPAPALVTNLQSSTVSAFGRGLTNTAKAGQFKRDLTGASAEAKPLVVSHRSRAHSTSRAIKPTELK